MAAVGEGLERHFFLTSCVRQNGVPGYLEELLDSLSPRAEEPHGEWGNISADILELAKSEELMSSNVFSCLAFLLHLIGQGHELTTFFA